MSSIEKEYLRDNLPNNLENQKTSISINKNFSGKCKMKILGLVILLLSLINCNNSNNQQTKREYIHGWVVSENEKPIKGVKVTYSKDETVTYTDNNGYFRFEPETISDKPIFFEKDEYKKDTIRGGINYRDIPVYFFTSKRKDTIIVKK